MSTAVPYAEFLGSQDPITILEATADRLSGLSAKLSPERIAAPIAPGKWSIHQIVAHLADSELVANVRFRMMLFEDAPTLAAYDQDRWMTGWMRESEPFEKTLERFRVNRKSTLRALRSATDLTRQGMHTERGVITVRDYMVTMAGHDINHLRVLEALA